MTILSNDHHCLFRMFKWVVDFPISDHVYTIQHPRRQKEPLYILPMLQKRQERRDTVNRYDAAMYYDKHIVFAVGDPSVP